MVRTFTSSFSSSISVRPSGELHLSPSQPKYKVHTSMVYQVSLVSNLRVLVSLLPNRISGRTTQTSLKKTIIEKLKGHG